MDLLLDPCLFQMEVESVKHWRTIIANLVSQENSTFRDLLGKYRYVRVSERFFATTFSFLHFTILCRSSYHVAE